MKKIWVMLLAVVLTLSAFTACGCTPQDMNGTTPPPSRPVPVTTPATVAPTTPATTPATEHATTPALPMPDETDGSETGVVGSEAPTEGTTDPSGPMSRRMPGGRGIR